VVVDGCRLNRTSVEAGEHDVAVVGPGTVVITGPDGAEAGVVDSASGSVAGQVPAMPMGEGTWTFTCESATASATATVQVGRAE